MALCMMSLSKPARRILPIYEDMPYVIRRIGPLHGIYAMFHKRNDLTLQSGT
jgi:hypothetical protein